MNIKFREQEKRTELKEVKQEYIALNAVDKELAYNLIQLRLIEEIINNQSLNHMDLTEANQKLHLKTDKWDKHSDIIEVIDTTTTNFLPTLQSFYINIRLGIINEHFQLKTVKELIELLLTAKVLLEDYLDIHRRKFAQAKNNK
ncbi:hypothetical protein [Priestia megaterium]|uniref:hypothetical protein n=1 Tax=Priestia megaterium TaxID=1404 RepID=UPI002E1D896F|nr:hypothetical protein [Priestia megaterium]